MSPLTRVNYEPVDRAPPAVPAGDDGPNQASVHFGDEEGPTVLFQQDSKADCAVSMGRLGLGIRPLGQYLFDVIDASRPDQHSTDSLLAARRERNSSASEATACRRAPWSGPWASSDRDAEGITRSGQAAKTWATSSTFTPCAPTPGAR